MITGSTVALGAFGAFALTDWWAVATRRRAVELVAKPATLAALTTAALLVDPVDARVRAWFVAGLALGLLGDVFLLFEKKTFLHGLVSFLLGHLAYVAGLTALGLSARGVAIGLALVALGGATVGRRIVPAVRAGPHAKLTVPVIAYLLVISIMVVCAAGSERLLALAGAVLFYASDSVIAWSRFVRDFPHARVAIMVSYHVAQLLLLASIVKGW